MPRSSLLLPDCIDRDFHRRKRSSVLKPVCGVPVLGPAHSGVIVCSDAISMVSDRSLQYVDGAWSVLMVVNRPELDLSLNEAKTHIVDATQASFNFLGFTIQMSRGAKTGNPYPNVRPADKSLKKIKARLTELRGRNLTPSLCVTSWEPRTAACEAGYTTSTTGTQARR